jgi:hypothetical protein
MRTVNSYADLLNLFQADDFSDLNRSVYKDTDCGASISIYGTVAAEDATDEERRSAARVVPWEVREEYERVLPLLTAAHVAATPQERTQIEAADASFQDGDPAALIEWARTIVPGAFPSATVAPERVPVAYHNGHDEDIPASFLLDGFTIQTIVEGSDATVDSDTFPLGTTEEEVDAWIADMEAEADSLWREANEDEEGDVDDSPADPDADDSVPPFNHNDSTDDQE